MASINPDYARYIDLSPYDKDSTDLYEAAIATLQIRNPGWLPEESNIEVMLLQAMAVLVSESIFSINQLPRVQVEAQLALLNIAREPGVRSTVTLQFEMIDDAGYIIPAGTEVDISLSNGEVYQFVTDTTLVISETSFLGTVTATAIQYGDDANSSPVGTTGDLSIDIPGVFEVKTFSEVIGGIDPESTESWLNRGIQRLQRLTQTLVTPAHFASFALEHSYVARANAVDSWDMNSGNAPGEDGGHITVVAFGPTTFLTVPEKQALTDEMAAISLANLEIHIVDPVITPINIDVTVKRAADYDDASVEANVTAAMDDYLSTQHWAWARYVRFFDLISIISKANGVDYVVSLTDPAADIDLGNTITLTTPGTITVTVV